MALLNCPDCGKEMASSAPSCPHCGSRALWNQNLKKNPDAKEYTCPDCNATFWSTEKTEGLITKQIVSNCPVCGSNKVRKKEEGEFVAKALGCQALIYLIGIGFVIYLVMKMISR